MFPKQQRSCKSNFASRFVLNINAHQCSLIIPYITTIHVLKHLSFKEKSYICILNKVFYKKGAPF